MTNNCSNVITLKQYGSTCWFNSILMALLYSDNSRKLLLKKSNIWDDKILIFKTIKHILKKKFLRTNNIFKDYLYFDKIRPEYILYKLYKYNKKKFNFNPKKYNAYLSSLYIRKVYKLLGVKVLYLDLYENNLYYSLYNNTLPSIGTDNYIIIKFKFVSKEKIMEKFDNPDVIIVNIGSIAYSVNEYPYYYKVSDSSNFLDIIKLNDSVKINNTEYVQDSVILANWNRNKEIGHSIVGIKCKGDRYVYNGWTRSTIDYHINDLKIVEDDVQNENLWIIKIINKKIAYVNTKNNNIVSSYLPKDGKIIGNNIEIPCELMKYDWNIKKNNNFCLNLSKCGLDLHSNKSIQNIQNENLCFSFNKGKRHVIYINKNSSNLDNIKENNTKCPKDKVKNPATERCIKIKTINKVNQKPLIGIEKKCPEGKIVNPKTGRCIKIKTINKVNQKPLIGIEKKCPEGKIVNPKTGRCIKIKTINKVNQKPLIGIEKKCPEGKIVNPKTGRCIKIKTINKVNQKPLIGIEKKCPEGKIFNPKTGRCIKIKTINKVNQKPLIGIEKK